MSINEGNRKSGYNKRDNKTILDGNLFDSMRSTETSGLENAEEQNFTLLKGATITAYGTSIF